MTEGLEQQDALAEVLSDRQAQDAAPAADAAAAEAGTPSPPPEQSAEEAADAPVPDPAAGRADDDRRFNERLNMSEAMLREQHGDADVDAKLAAFQREAARDPGLRAALRQQAHPWAWMYRQAQRALAAEEIGADPDAYRNRVREEVRAEMSRTPAAPAPRATSLAAGRSSAPRDAAWSGPAPLSDILRR